LSGLAGIPFFAALSADQAEHFDGRCQLKKVSEGSLILDFNDESSAVFFILSGAVRILVRTPGGKEMILGDCAAGDFFGELAAIDGALRSANVTALNNTEMLIVSASVFREILAVSPETALRLMSRLADRVRLLNERLFESRVLDVRHRLYSELLRMAAPRKGKGEEMIISPPPFQHDLAARIGCRREQVNRELNRMKDEELASSERGGLVLPRPAELRRRIRVLLDASDAA
jgi:CRP/FNR family cyclic AMP-dependent transcriptional regulator